MKKTASAVLLVVLFLSSPVLADWAENFLATAAKNGIDPAVEEAFSAGVSPYDIVTMTRRAGDIEPAAVIKALYCAGVSGSAVQSVARATGIDNAAVAAGFKESVGQCGPAAALNPDPFSRTQDIFSKGSPVSGGDDSPVIPPGIDGDGGNGTVVHPPASPSRFN
jgi:hypothetical protein